MYVDEAKHILNVAGVKGDIYLNQSQFTPALDLIDMQYRPGPAEYREDRGAPDAFGPLVTETEVKAPDFVDKETLARFPEMARSWFRREHLGARHVGRHTFTTGGFLDDILRKCCMYERRNREVILRGIIF